MSDQLLATNRPVIVLVEPQGAGNVGSVCRAMYNYGATDLRLVNPQVDHLGREARNMAVKAAEVLERATIYASLPEALSDCSLSIGTTRRFGRYREGMLHPDEAADLMLNLEPESTCALVFGREDKGLFTSELDLCQHFVTIPTDARLPSMNLAQAVVVCLYEVYKRAGELAGQPHGRKKLANNQQLEALYRHMTESLLNIDYLNPQNPDHIMRTYRRILGRAGLNEREVRILRGMFNQIDIATGIKKGKRGAKD
ncbi:RNA methyltransferase [Pelovirga terrestris]|uniref:tRNA (cytidine/uridine-2'-O-)-methyltransferase TrmJ n=1 Tax=Pelovirga terrestris TaxID=2771352 RepID=A0A8J6QTH7_9BACT|nr:RNA methyltransferase [Pelovirga terrestris]MBD1399305.1 RNA methyltransferase [Pelovirga terrestris]